MNWINFLDQKPADGQHVIVLNGSYIYEECYIHIDLNDSQYKEMFWIPFPSK